MSQFLAVIGDGLPSGAHAMSDEQPYCPFSDPERLFEDLAACRADVDGFPFSETYGARLVTRYDDIVTALHDPTTFSSRPTVPDMPSPWRERFAGRVPDRGTLLGIDNPVHDRLRASVNTFFIPRRLARFEPWIAEEAHRLVDGFVARGTTDLKTSFALPLPLRTISHIVGLGAEQGEWVGESLSFFLGDRDLYHRDVGGPEPRAQRLLDLHEHLLAVMAARKVDRHDDLISHIWNERDAGTVTMTDFEMLSMFPGLMLAGHETSSNLICMALSHLLRDRGLYEAAQRDDQTRAAALEEMFRFESAITGMKREVTRDTVLGGVPLKAGEIVLLAYAEGSRDPAVFAEPDRFDLDRDRSTPHLGFGQGVHACLGAPLARLLLRVELRVLHERLPDLRLAVGYDHLQHTEVSEGRGIVALPLAWTPTPADVPRLAMPTAAVATPPSIPVVVQARREVTADIVELTLAADRDDLPEWKPGAHIDVEIPGGSVRQYSLCGPSELPTFQIAVLRDPAGRGGSVALHDAGHPGRRLAIRGPRNHFALKPAGRFTFVAGGIGITPLLPMVEEAARRRVEWRLIYLGRHRESMAYVSELESTYRARVRVWTTSENGARFDVASLFEYLGPDELVYGCGPESLMSDLEDAATAVGSPGRVIVERFSPRDVVTGPNRSIEVVLARCDDTVRVAADESILDALNRAGLAILSTCREGTCGTCEVGVLDGTPEHRDAVLSLDERLANTSIITCVSRCRGTRLVLDL